MKEYFNADEGVNLDSGYDRFYREMYEKLRNESASYKIVFSELCLNVLRVIYESSEKADEYGDDFFDKIFTKESIMKEAKNIAGFYNKFNFFPQMILVDTHFVWSLPIQEFIKELSLEVYKYIDEDKKSVFHRFYSFEDCFLNNVKITAPFLKDGPVVMETPYLKRLDFKKDRTNLFWNNTLCKSYLETIIALQKTFAQNTVYSPSFINVENIDNILGTLEKEQFVVKVIDNMYVASRLIENNNSVIGAYIVRIKKMINDKYTVTPNIWFNELTNVNIVVEELENLLFSNGISSIKQAIEGLQETKTGTLQFLMFFLSYNLNLIICEDILKAKQASRFIDIKKLNCYFNGKFNKEIFVLLKEITSQNKKMLSLNEMDTIFKTMSKNTFDKIITNTDKSTRADAFRKSLNLALTEQAYRYELDAMYKKSNSGAALDPLVFIEYQPIENLMATVSNIVGVENKAKLNELFIELARYFDYYYINLKCCVGENSKNSIYSLSYQPTYKSFWLKFESFLEYKEMLFTIEFNCVENLSYMEKDIANIFEDKQKAEDIIKKLNILYRCGYRIQDINMPTFGIDGINGSDLYDSDKEQIIKMSKIFVNKMKQQNKVDEYYKKKVRR